MLSAAYQDRGTYLPLGAITETGCAEEIILPCQKMSDNMIIRALLEVEYQSEGSFRSLSPAAESSHASATPAEHRDELSPNNRLPSLPLLRFELYAISTKHFAARHGWASYVRVGSCVTSTAGPNGVA